MRITVKARGARRIFIVLPTDLVFSPTMISLWLRIGRKYSSEVPNISSHDLRAICKAIKETKRSHGSYELVTVESGEGDLVKIIL
jgi:hypothetical protein